MVSPMKVTFLAALTLSLASLGASSAEPSHYDVALANYAAAVSKLCPSKHLELLGPGGLRGALDKFKSTLSKPQRDRMNHDESVVCAEITWGSDCVNNVDIDVANELKIMNRLAAKVCRSFRQCHEQSDCD